MTEHVELQQLVNRTSNGNIHSPNLLINKRPLLRRCPFLGLMLATLSSLFFSLSSVIVKSMESVHPMELAAFRFVGVLLPAIPILIYKDEEVFPKGKRKMLLLRSFVGTTSLMLSFYAFRYMPLGDASVVVFSVPVFVAIFAKLFLKEPCGRVNVVSIVLTLIGVVLITRPHILFGGGDSSVYVDDNTRIWGPIAAVCSTLFGANVYILLRALKGLHSSVILTNFGTFALVQTILVTWLTGGLCMPACGTDRVLVVCLAAFSFFGQILLTMSLQLEQAGPVSIARSADIVFAFVWQIIFFGEIPNAYSITGALLVLCSLIIVGLRKWAMSLPDGSSIKNVLAQ